MNVKEKVFEIVASVCETEVSNVNENSTIGDFPQWDSMGHLTILSNVVFTTDYYSIFYR